MRQPDMSRPVPAAPSPGSSAARQKLMEADRQRISKAVAARFADRKPKPERKGILRRLTRGDEEWAYLEDGSLWCFRVGQFERGVIVTPRYGPFQGKVGVIMGLAPSWGENVAIAVWFRKEKRVSYDRDSGTVAEYFVRPPAFWRPEQLEPLGHIDKGAK